MNLGWEPFSCPGLSVFICVMGQGHQTEYLIEIVGISLETVLASALHPGEAACGVEAVSATMFHI